MIKQAKNEIGIYFHFLCIRCIIEMDQINERLSLGEIPHNTMLFEATEFRYKWLELKADICNKIYGKLYTPNTGQLYK